MASVTVMAGAESRHRQPAGGWILAALTHLGLLLVCFSGAYTAQPADFPHRKWVGIVALALVMLVWAIATRGRSGFSISGKLATGLAAGLVLSLTYDPQLSDLPVLGSLVPASLADVHLGVATLGVVWAAILGLAYLALGRFYELETLHLVMLISNVVQYYLLVLVVMGMSGRSGVGRALQVYLALTLLLACARNLALPSS